MRLVKGINIGWFNKKGSFGNLSTILDFMELNIYIDLILNKLTFKICQIILNIEKIVLNQLQ